MVRSKFLCFIKPIPEGVRPELGKVPGGGGGDEGTVGQRVTQEEHEKLKYEGDNSLVIGETDPDYSITTHEDHEKHQRHLINVNRKSSC